MTLLTNFWQLFMISAPWLLLGLFIAALINVYLPKDFLNKHLGKEGFWTTVKAALIGAPMPLCSCGVIPAAVGLRRAGASKSATTAFLVSTPETGVDSISVSYVLLGPFMAIIRPIAAIASAITAGVLVGQENKAPQLSQEQTDKQCSENTGPKHTQGDTATRCCASEAEPVVKKIVAARCCDSAHESKPMLLTSQSKCSNNDVAKDENCCETAPVKQESCCNEEHPATASQWFKLKQAFHFSATKLLQDTAVWLMIGLFFASLVQTFVPAGFLAQWGSGLIAMAVMVLVSIPMYICATASTPIAAGLLLSGVSPGAVLVFMLAGPATNIATLGVVAKELGKRAVLAYLTGVVGVALIFGYLTDYLVAEFGFEVAPSMAMGHEVLPYWLELSAAVLLAALLIRLLVLYFSSHMRAQTVQP